MRTFAFACAIAVVMAKKKHHDKKEEPKKEETIRPAVEPKYQPEKKPEPAHKMDFYEKIETFDFYAKHIWNGCYQGLYGMGKLDARPSDECFGEWIPEKLKEVN